MISNTQFDAIPGSTVKGTDGEKIGKVVDVYASSDGGTPTFVTVSTGLFGGKASFVPLDQATMTGDEVVVPYSKELVKDAPRLDTDEELTAQEEERLYSHYSLSSGYGAETTTATTGTDATYTEGAGHDTSGPNTDSAMTRSEEHLQVGTAEREAGRARLRKRVVTEQETATVPVRHEEVRVTREPITDANAGNAYDGPAISEEEHEVVLTEEVAVAGKEAVPVERVRLDTETVTEQQTVTEDVRKEVIETEGVERR